jgi:hypothetical protein
MTMPAAKGSKTAPAAPAAGVDEMPEPSNETDKNQPPPKEASGDPLEGMRKAFGKPHDK